MPDTVIAYGVGITCICILSIVMYTLFCFFVFHEHDVIMERFEFNVIRNKTGNDTCVLMIAIDYPPAAVSRECWIQYCKQHNYNFVELVDSNYTKETMGIAWWRISAIMTLFKQHRYKYVMHVDADTVPLNLGISIDAHRKRSNSEDTVLWVSEDNLIRNKKYFNSINFGVFIIKNDQKTMKMLQDVWAERLVRNEWPREQGAIEDWLVKNVHSQEEWNKYYHVSKYNTFQSFGMITDNYNTWDPNMFSRDPQYVVQNAGKYGAWIFHAVMRPPENMISIFNRIKKTYTLIEAFVNANANVNDSGVTFVTALYDIKREQLGDGRKFYEMFHYITDY